MARWECLVCLARRVYQASQVFLVSREKRVSLLWHTQDHQVKRVKRVDQAYEVNMDRKERKV